MTVQGGLTSGKELYCWNKQRRYEGTWVKKSTNILKGEIISSVFYILLGLCLILIPTQTVDVICKVVFGLILIGAGIYHIYIYIRGKAKATIMDLLSGVVCFWCWGCFLFMTPSIVIKLLPWMLSAFVLVDSLWKFKGAFLLKKGGNGAWSVLLIGSLVFIALGIVMLFGRFPKIMTLLIFSGWVLVCDGAADIVFYIIMKLGLRKIAKKAETEKEDSGADSSDAVNETADMDVPNDTRTQDENAPSEQQSGKETEYPTETTAETTAAMLAQDADGYSADRKETEESTEPEEEQKQKNSRWEKEPENVEMKLWAVGKDQAETGSLKDLLDGSDEELEEWKD